MGYGTSNFGAYGRSMSSVTYGFNIRTERSKDGILWRSGTKTVQKWEGIVGYFSFSLFKSWTYRSLQRREFKAVWRTSCVSVRPFAHSTAACSHSSINFSFCMNLVKSTAHANPLFSLLRSSITDRECKLRRWARTSAVREMLYSHALRRRTTELSC